MGRLAHSFEQLMGEVEETRNIDITKDTTYLANRLIAYSK